MVTTCRPPRQADVADDAADPAARDKDARTLRPAAVEFVEEREIRRDAARILSVPELSGGVAVLLQQPVRGRGDDEVDALVGKPPEVPRIALAQEVTSETGHDAFAVVRGRGPGRKHGKDPKIKPVNLAVGRAIWNRFGDIRTFAVNLHLKFPFAVVGGVLVLPTYEVSAGRKKDTTHLIDRAVDRLARAGGRENEGGAPHLLEAVGVVVYDPDKGRLDPTTPPLGSGLRWNEFVDDLAVAYEARFGGG